MWQGSCPCAPVWCWHGDRAQARSHLPTPLGPPWKQIWVGPVLVVTEGVLVVAAPGSGAGASAQVGSEPRFPLRSPSQSYLGSHSHGSLRATGGFGVDRTPGTWTGLGLQPLHLLPQGHASGICIWLSVTMGCYGGRGIPLLPLVGFLLAGLFLDPGSGVLCSPVPCL